MIKTKETKSTKKTENSTKNESDASLFQNDESSLSTKCLNTPMREYPTKRFQELSTIGEGAYGVVVKALDKQMQKVSKILIVDFTLMKNVAIKEFKDQVLS